MSVTRRGFLKILGGATAAAIVAPKLVLPETTLIAPPKAPLFVPAQNLDMGVPTGRLITGRQATAADLHALWQESQARFRGQEQAPLGDRVPMLMLQDNYIKEYGGRIAAGAEVLVDTQTAERWMRNGVAEPGPRAPRELQMQSAQRRLERRSAYLKGDRLPEWRPREPSDAEVIAHRMSGWTQGTATAYDWAPDMRKRV